jgi:hypothetical protein
MFSLTYSTSLTGYNPTHPIHIFHEPHIVDIYIHENGDKYVFLIVDTIREIYNAFHLSVSHEDNDTFLCNSYHSPHEITDMYHPI